MKKISFILLKFVIHVTNKQFSDKFGNGWKNKIDLVGAITLSSIMASGYCRVYSCLEMLSTQ